MRSLFTQLLPKYFCLLSQGLLANWCCVHAEEVPAFVNESIYSSNTATISVVEPTLAADLIIMEGGLEQNVRTGMICRVFRGDQLVGELIIIASTSDQSAGLILNLTDGWTFQAGDIARVKTFQNS